MRSLSLAIMATLVLSSSPLSAQQSAPTREQLASAVRRLVSQTANSDVCSSLGVVRGEHQYSCRVHSCVGACRSHYRVTVLAFRGGRARVVSRSEVEGGDTGRCGCCLVDI